MDIAKLNSDYTELINEFGDAGAATVSGMRLPDIKTALTEENSNTTKLFDFISSRQEAYAAYTKEQCELLLKLEHLIVKCNSAGKAAAVIGKSASVVSNIRKNKYRGNVNDFFSSLASYFDVKQEHAKTYQGTDYVPTSVSECIYQTIRSAHIVGACEIITGDTGIGKTRTIKKYAMDFPENTIVVTPSYADSSVIGIMKLIAAQLGINGLCRASDLNAAVLGRLHDGMLIIVDEAQHLKFTSLVAIPQHSYVLNISQRALALDNICVVKRVRRPSRPNKILCLDVIGELIIKNHDRY